MRLWFVPLNVLVAALCIHGIAQEHHPLGRFHSDAKRKGTLPGGLGPGTHHPLCLKAEDVMSCWGGGFMKKVVFQLSLVRLLVWFCCDFAGCFWCSLFVFLCVYFYSYTFQFLKLQSLRWVVTGSCRDYMVPFQSPPWSSFTHGCCTRSLWHTHSNIHFLIDFLQTCNYSVSHSFEHSLIHPAIHPIASQDGTNLAVRQISATHVNSPLLVHLIWADHYIPFVHSTIFMSSPSFFPFICRLSTHSLVQSVFLTLVRFAWSSCNPILDIVQLVQNRRHKGLVVFVVVN